MELARSTAWQLRAAAMVGLLALPAVAAVVLTWAGRDLLDAVRRPAPTVDQYVSLLAAVGCGLLLAAVALGSLLTLLTAALPAAPRGLQRAARALTPALLRQVAGVALGVTVAGAPLAATASTTPTTRPPAATMRHDVPPALSARWSPDRPAGDAAVVVVRRGDSLWRIAERHLDRPAGAAAVAREWPRWYAANRRVIGADPGLLRPGQRLHSPSRPDHADPDHADPDHADPEHADHHDEESP